MQANGAGDPQHCIGMARAPLSGLVHLETLLAVLDRPWHPLGFRLAELERSYNDAARPRRAKTRVIMFGIALVIFGLAPWYGASLLQTPAALIPLYRKMEFLVLLPMSVAGIWFNLRWPLQRWVTTYTVVAAVSCIGLLTLLRHAGMPYGFSIPFETVAIAAIIVAILAGLRTWQTLGILALSAVVLLVTERLAVGGESRFWWSVVAAAVVFAFAVAMEITLDLGSRRAWLTHQIAEMTGMRDVLTGLPNRAWFERDAQKVLQQASREQVPVAVLLFDVDHFKQLNDSCGHAAGDDCLRRIGELLVGRYARRPLDLRARIGGEEFILLLYGADADGARQTAEQLLRDVRMLEIPHPASPVGGIVTVSAGLIHEIPEPGADIWHLVSHADHWLYEAKRGGRNQWRG